MKQIKSWKRKEIYGKDTMRLKEYYKKQLKLNILKMKIQGKKRVWWNVWAKTIY